ncbi:HAD family hydrolase [Pacificibacter marinus]|uniref:Putative hydrolase YutF n=1 Tax=Pacificibacter marinus TaxID=658057 RepID=A0A1Y5TKD4_9RHOB|nr:HAD family hydrolase [Pacificibacter marinus]SEL29554.1 Ribonucleotide monophosphatase NagD, HAD superfamily [Pacificibacter marinus]SLN66328.1 putative hydrolase YutF [Pacificibacter marinus]
MDATTTIISLTNRFPKLDPHAVENARIVLCDLDGCLISEGRAYSETAGFVAACGARLWIVSNSSDTTAEIMAKRLVEMDIAVPAARILLAGEIALNHLAEVQNIRHLRLFACAELKARARAMGLDPEARDPDAILLCRDPGVTVDTLGEILALVARGVPLWVANEDLSHPGHDNQPVAETGALLAALCAIAPDLRWKSLGKPDPKMLSMALAQTGLRAQDAVFVGDNALTDGRAAADLGMPFIHIQRSAAQ